MTYYEHNAKRPTWELVEFQPEPASEASYVVEESELTDGEAEQFRLACAAVVNGEG